MPDHKIEQPTAQQHQHQCVDNHGDEDFVAIFFVNVHDVVLVLPAIPAYFREKHIVSRYIVIQYVISFFDMPQGFSPM